MLICPNCKADLLGGLIYETFLKKYKDEEKALETSMLYGATKTEGRWQLAIGIYSRDEDRVVAYECPKCGHREDRVWNRN